ncbi:hypothetical protein [Acidithiobacillus ferrooxidans]|uniref:Uncharacterized protein n=1 Tax=Acidithiobacillus ferrooxidans TaxID=920 RepID=A0A2W1KHV5_ACIFR|nr:hypothetical protein [Acidithiobacillus ferrooxidans]MBU2818332.1 hypothetical protein [Acidithiobacillus ferrooxidans]MCR1344168.1 hypothetical protein [Acidithiobacillus ferrooxidans]PZD82002.1 hypothetical protein DN052_02795 [Acidithiobacillus ferrooxidans]QLK41707.1 hypothetical protein FE661_05690 [Acidithiobacillus ferrooxidans]QZT53656.1 hypothetical protein K7B00_05670 [Acidithiobacillus ferrooxidans]
MKTERIMILWDHSEAKGVHNVLMVERTGDGLRYPQRYSDGAVFADWKERGSLAVVFGQMLAHGFKSPAAMVEALEQFAAIEDCGPWARDLIGGISAWGQI